MEYVQERVATLHDFGGAAPEAPVDRATVVVPLTDRDHASLAAERVLSTLGEVGPESVVVALRADEGKVEAVREWVDSLGVDADILWCNAPAVRELLGDHGLNGEAGKGRDVWLALGVAAARSDLVAVHDADATTYGPEHVPRLLFPLARDYEFVKGYYARVENDRLYGRLCRLFYEPVVAALAETTDDPLVEYLGAFRYALAGEFAATSDLVRQLRPPRGWGLEVATLGDAFRTAGFEGTAQVDLGIHEHDHRAVSGRGGLSDMADEVAAALFAALDDGGVAVDYDDLRERYRATARRLVDQYAADAAFNGLDYDPADERRQVDAYAESVRAPAAADRLPAWVETDLDPDAVRRASRDALADATGR
ncbi:glycosyltransferase family protein [Halosimplex halophilum]|uniref:glycosyl transferase family 2 n=1 Tax=Halosimplex halophilum TaxID=2559572 RepID=UPI00107F9FEC|nr:glycosyl transferase family 2 [Halosimplex halophilum]